MPLLFVSGFGGWFVGLLVRFRVRTLKRRSAQDQSSKQEAGSAIAARARTGDGAQQGSVVELVAVGRL
jgi:hypothetical protein